MQRLGLQKAMLNRASTAWPTLMGYLAASCCSNSTSSFCSKASAASFRARLCRLASGLTAGKESRVLGLGSPRCRTCAKQAGPQVHNAVLCLIGNEASLSNRPKQMPATHNSGLISAECSCFGMVYWKLHVQKPVPFSVTCMDDHTMDDSTHANQHGYLQ